MKIIEKKIDELIEADYNPRLLTEKQKSDLEESLTKFGIVDPILINKNKDRKNIIIGGHQRCRVWKKMGNDTVPCIELDLTLEKERELNVRLNKNTGEFDITLLKEHFEDNELMSYGFEDFEIGVFESDDINIEEDEIQLSEKRGFKIEFKREDYDEAKALYNQLEEDGMYVGKILIDAMRKAKK